MKSRIFFLFGFILTAGMLAIAYGDVETTQFTVDMSSTSLYEPNTNRPHLILKPGGSEQILLTVTNYDSKTHTINLQMSTDDSLHDDRVFSFNPVMLEIMPNATETSVLTVSATQNASTGTTVWHTLIAKSNTFGAKALGFYVEVSEQPSPPPSDQFRRGSPGGMFPSETRFDIDENVTINKVPYNILAPQIPEGYFFQGMYGLESPEQLIYSKNPVSSDTRDLEFWDDGGLLISFKDKKHFTFDQRLGFLDANQQQIKLNGWNGTASESLMIGSSDGDVIYSDSVVTVFLDDVQIRIESQMPLEDILKIAESMIVKNTSESSPYWGVVAESPKLHSPLKQFKSGIPFSETKCNGNLQLTQKYNDSPACVKPEHYFELIKRGWVSDIIIAVQSRDVFLDPKDALSSHMDKIIPTLDDFKNALSESKDIDVIFSKFGEPHDDIGSGIHIYVYELNDDTKVWIGYVNDIWYVRHVDSNGNVLGALFEKNEHNTPDRLKGVFGSCACHERTKSNPDTMERCPQPHITWENSTHYIDNIICEWREK